MPESLIPPHEHWQVPCEYMWSLIQTEPASRRRAIRSPFSRSSVQTEAERPKFESFASWIASSSDATGTIGTTGPKISSRMMRMSCLTPVSTVGA